MTVLGRKLEENEAQMDNVLHKILVSNNHIKELASQITYSSTGTYLTERIKRIKILNDTIRELTLLADEIDMASEKLTEELEAKITSGLDKAIEDINAAKELLEDEETQSK